MEKKIDERNYRYAAIGIFINTYILNSNLKSVFIFQSC